MIKTLTTLDVLYANARKYFKTKRDTHLNREGNRISLFYHDTEVVKMVFNKKTSIRLNTGGYPSMTTLKRFNEFAQLFNLGFKVSQVRYQWIIYCNGQSTKWTTAARQYRDSQGRTVGWNKSPVNVDVFSFDLPG